MFHSYGFSIDFHKSSHGRVRSFLVYMHVRSTKIRNGHFCITYFTSARMLPTSSISIWWKKSIVFSLSFGFASFVMEQFFDWTPRFFFILRLNREECVTFSLLELTMQNVYFSSSYFFIQFKSEWNEQRRMILFIRLFNEIFCTNFSIEIEILFSFEKEIFHWSRFYFIFFSSDELAKSKRIFSISLSLCLSWTNEI